MKEKDEYVDYQFIISFSYLTDLCKRFRCKS